MSRRDGGRGGAASEEIEAFSRGLYPILVNADTAAFRRYLAQWEDVIGDTAELTATPQDQLRRTMAALLRRPQQFGLPPWAHVPGPAPAGPAPAGPAPGGEVPVQAPLPLRRAPPAPVTPPERRPAATPSAIQDQAPPQPPQAPEAAGPAGAFQVDMLTGELVPVPETGIAEPPAAPYAVADESSAPARKRRTRRRVPRGMEQLTFLPALEAPE